MAWKIAQKLLDNPEFYGINVSKSTAGATVIDAGVNAPGGFQAGKKLTELCMGGAGKAQLGFKNYSDLTFPSITISTDHPAIAALGSQFAGWRIKDGDSIAIGSGPVRALALKPKDVFEEIGYKDVSDKAVLTLESNNLPSDALIEKVATASNIKAENLIVVVAPTASIAGLTQVAGRVVEVGIHKLRTLGLSPKIIRYALGYAPIPPLGTDFEVAMARTNDAILYGGTVYLTVDYDDEAGTSDNNSAGTILSIKRLWKTVPADFPRSRQRLLQNRPRLIRPSSNNNKQCKNWKNLQGRTNKP